MSAPVEYRVRPALASDAEQIVALVRGLAEFEQLPGPDAGAAERLARHGFGQRPYFEALVVEGAGELVAFALYVMTYSTFRARPSLYLEDLFVRPAHRRRGLATRLLAELARIALARECGRFEWAVLDWNDAAQSFYRSLGAAVLPDWRICRIDTPAALDRLAALANAQPVSG